MSGMIEWVARAQFWNAHEGHAGPGDVWEALRPEEREQWLRAARVAIEAMREPTQGMTVLGASAMRTDDLDPTLEEVSAGYRAMIDAALAEGTEAATTDG